MKRVFIFQPYLAPYRINLFNEINSNKKIELHVLYFSEYEKRRKWQFKKRINFTEFKIPQLTFRLSYEKNFSIQNMYSLYKYIREYMPDIVIASANMIGFSLATLKSLFKYKLIIWQESTDSTERALKRNFIFYKIKKNIMKKSDNFIVPGLLSKRFLEKKYPFIEKDIIFLAPNTVDDDFEISDEELKRKYHDLKCLKFYFSGSLNLRKGIDIVYNVFNQLENLSEEFNYGHELNIMGVGNFKNKTCNINFLGYLNGEEYIQKVKNSHVFILPARYDCNPLTVVEALKSGNILLVSEAVGNYPEFVKDNGFILSVNDIDGLKSKVEYLLKQSQDKLQYMAKKSLEISKNITHKNSAKVFIDVIFS